jgi:hypothetical protein
MTSVEIANLALGWIGQKAISSFDDGSVPAELCKANFDAAARTALERRAWMFATQRLTLEPAAQTGDAAWPTSFVLPATVVRVLGADDGSGAWETRWRREGQTILSEDGLATMYVRAIMDVGDPTTWSPGFTRAVALRVASDLCGPLTENATLADRLEAKYELAVRTAGTMDGLQGSSEPGRQGRCARARR